MAVIPRYDSTTQVGDAVSRVDKVKLDNSGTMANVKAGGALGNAILAGANELHQTMVTTDIMQANNEYNSKMNELQAKLFENKEGNARDNMEKYTEGRTKILDEVMKKGPSSMRDPIVRAAFMQTANKDWVNQQNRMRMYVMGEEEKNQNTVMNNGLSDCLNNANTAYGNDTLVTDALDKGSVLITQRFRNYGQDKINAEIEKWKGRVYTSTISSAITNEDYDRAGALLQGHGRYIEPNLRASISKIITERKRSDMMLGSMQSLYSQYGKDIDSAWSAYSKTLGKDNGAGIVKYANGQIGQQLGNNTCAIFVTNAIAAAGGDTSLNSPTADLTYRNYEDKGLTFNDKSQLRDGDIVFWQVEGSKYKASNDRDAVNSDEYAYKGITHVGIYDAKTGKVIQSGNSGISAMPVDMEGYTFVGGAHQPGQTLSPTDMEKRRQEFYRDYQPLVQQQLRQENLQVENMANQLLAMAKDGNTYTKQDLEKVIYGMTGNNAKMYNALLPMATSFSRQQRDVLPIEAQIELEDAIGTGQVSQADLVKQLSNYNLAPETVMHYVRMNKQAIAKQGEFKYDWNDLEKALYDREGGKDKVTAEQMMGAVRYAKRFVRDFQLDEKNKGKTLSPDQILDQMEDSLTTNAISFGSKGLFGGQIQYTPAQLALHGIYNIQEGGSNTVIVYRYGNAYGERMTKDAFVKEMD